MPRVRVYGPRLASTALTHHDLGTAQGDPTEANWVGEHFQRERELVVGSVKGNIGSAASLARRYVSLLLELTFTLQSPRDHILPGISLQGLRDL